MFVRVTVDRMQDDGLAVIKLSGGATFLADPADIVTPAPSRPCGCNACAAAQHGSGNPAEVSPYCEASFAENRPDASEAMEALADGTFYADYDKGVEHLGALRRALAAKDSPGEPMCPPIPANWLEVYVAGVTHGLSIATNAAFSEGGAVGDELAGKFAAMANHYNAKVTGRG